MSFRVSTSTLKPLKILPPSILRSMESSPSLSPSPSCSSNPRIVEGVGEGGVIESVQDLNVTSSSQDRVDSFQVVNTMSSENTVESTVTAGSHDRVVNSAESSATLGDPSLAHWSLLTFLFGLMNKPIEFQVSLMVRLITFPKWVFYNWFAFVLHPFEAIKGSNRYISSKVAEIYDMVLSYLSSDDKSLSEAVFKFGWGLVWAVYVGVVLVALSALALLLGGFVMRLVVEEPHVFSESLNFDYTKNSPEACVPLILCSGTVCCGENVEMGNVRGSRIIRRNNKVEIGVSLSLPESMYNRNLGMFQVRLEFISAKGKRLASTSRLCILKYRSEPVRLVRTLLMIAPLVTGYASEAQTLNLKFGGIVVKKAPTACVKVTIEPRAEFRPGSGVPELSDASVVIHSELPFLKSFIWNWRRTLFVWTSMNVFILELLLALVFFRPLVIPSARHG